MKLRSKLFFSYFFLIVLFSIALFWLIVELRELTASLREHVRQDVHSVILVAEQQQMLERLNDAFLVCFISEAQWERKEMNLKQLVSGFSGNLRRLSQGLSTPYQRPWFDRFFNVAYRAIYGSRAIYHTGRIDSLNRNIKQYWQAGKNGITKSISALRSNDKNTARYLRDKAVHPALDGLQLNLNTLNHELGQRGIRQYNEMARIAQKSQIVILSTEVLIILLTILAAFVWARRFTKPILRLKTAVDQMAIENFEIKLENKSLDEIGELSRAFEQLAVRLRESGTYKTAMLSQFTHEMKSPLGSIKQAINLLENSLGSPVSSEQKRFISILRGNQEILQKRITDILQSATYDQEKIKLTYRFVNMVQLTKEVLVYLSPIIREKSLKVRMHFASEQIEAEIDYERIKEVLQNLVNNAIKFTGEGKNIRVEVWEKFPLVQIKVEDEGIGIPEKEIPYVFEKMYRASNSKSISVKGTGLGLYISSQIIKAHGGRIDLKSRLGEGSTFRISIPRNRKVAEEGGWLE